MKTLRKWGISYLEDVPWGTHHCILYEDKDTLIETLIPYFKAGLENNEFCVWIVSELINEKEARKLLAAAMPDFETYLKKGQIEIFSQDEWYLKDGVFDSERVLAAWLNKLNHALEKGFDGLRVSGDAGWAEGEMRNRVFEYEKQVASIIGAYKMIALCTYEECQTNDRQIMGAMYTHERTLGKREGKIKVIARARFGSSCLHHLDSLSEIPPLSSGSR